MTPTGDDGAVKLAQWAAGRNVSRPDAKGLARAVLTLTAQLQAANVELTALREALRPFAEAAEFVSENDASDSLSNDCYLARSAITAGDLRDAAAALTRMETKQ